ncbi:putative transposase [Forsythia ovata]|uniref:Transposase n=1 Tax=Forsythia ovata TaxID=205694 RepID=A0ABD1WZ79_9LAMI
MLDRGVDQWVELCNHFNSDKFRKSSFANIENRSKKKYNHRTGSCPLSYIVEEMAVICPRIKEKLDWYKRLRHVSQRACMNCINKAICKWRNYEQYVLDREGIQRLLSTTNYLEIKV